MLTLAIETSGLVGSLALLEGEACLEARTLQLGTQHGQSLVPEIRRLLADHGRSPRDCELLAVSIGPGSFTGLRVGVVCAKTWAYATGCQVVAVDTHLAIAANTPPPFDDVQIVSDAQRGDLFASRFARDNLSDWTEIEPLASLPVTAWLGKLTGSEVLAGPGLERLAEKLSGRCHLLEPDCWRPQAANVGRLGVKQAQIGVFSDPWTLEPRYVRRSSAEEKWDLRHRR